MELLQVGLTSVFSFLVLFLLAKLIGHKQIAQLDFFDYITGITIGSIAAEMATELEEPLKPLIAMVVYGLISIVLGLLLTKVQRARRYINGSPSILMDEGKLYRENLKKANLDLSEFMVMCRQQGYFDLEDIQTAVFEFTGKLSILPRNQARPVIPEDLGLTPQQDYIFSEVIMDGRILEKNLKRMGVDHLWLEKEVKKQGFHNPQEVFLGLCDRNKRLLLYKKSN